MRMLCLLSVLSAVVDVDCEICLRVCLDEWGERQKGVNGRVLLGIGNGGRGWGGGGGVVTRLEVVNVGLFELRIYPFFLFFCTSNR